MHLSLGSHERASLDLNTRYRLDRTAAGIRRALRQYDPLRGAGSIARPFGGAGELVCVRVARAHEGEPVGDQLFGEGVFRGRHGRERGRSVKSVEILVMETSSRLAGNIPGVRAPEHHPVLGGVFNSEVAGDGRVGRIVPIDKCLSMLRERIAHNLSLTRYPDEDRTVRERTSDSPHIEVLIHR